MKPQRERSEPHGNEFAAIKAAVRQVVREEGFFSRMNDLLLPPICDPDAELKVLAALLHGVVQKPFCGLEGRHFYSEAHQELFARCHLPWDQVRAGLSGDGAAVNSLLGCLKADCGPFAPGELSELAYRIKELADQRKLIEMFRSLEIELRFGKIQVCDAEHVLQEHLLRDVTGP